MRTIDRLRQAASSGLYCPQGEWVECDCGTCLIDAALPSLLAVAEAAEAVMADVHDLAYPESDVYGLAEPGDVNAPLWSEAGLYGRLGKEAARTVLARVNALRAALDELREAE